MMRRGIERLRVPLREFCRSGGRLERRRVCKVRNGDYEERDITAA